MKRELFGGRRTARHLLGMIDAFNIMKADRITRARLAGVLLHLLILPRVGKIVPVPISTCRGPDLSSVKRQRQRAIELIQEAIHLSAPPRRGVEPARGRKRPRRNG